MISRNPAEFAAIEETYSPVLHRVQQVIRWRAVHPMDEIPPPSEILTKYMKAPEHLLKQAKPFLDAMIVSGDVKRGKQSPTRTEIGFHQC